MIKNYIGYIRVSNKEHENSLPAQERKLREYVESKGLNMVKIYTEEKSAFGKANRKNFPKMIEHLKQEDIAGVIFHKVDRSSRNMKDFALIDGFLEIKDIRIIEGEFDTKTAAGKMMFRTFCNMAVWYSENLSEEVTLKMRERLRAGYYPTNPPFGYRKGIKNEDADWKKKYPNHNSRYVREMFELYDTGNHSYISIAKIMREKGVRNNVGGGKCSKKMVESILTNPFFCGTIRWTARKTGKVMYFEGNHQPLISKELFERTKDRREGRARVKGSFGGQETYSRMFDCGCGCVLYTETPTGRNGNRSNSYLRCQSKDCNFKSIRTDDLEDAIVQELKKYEINSDFHDEYKSVMEDMNDMIVEENRNQRQALNLRLIRLESELQRIRQGYLQEVFTAEEASKMRKDLNKEKKELTNRLNEESEALDVAFIKTAQKFLETFRVLSGCYKTASSDVKREVLDLFFSKRMLNNGRLVLEPTSAVKQVAKIADLSNG